MSHFTVFAIIRKGSGQDLESLLAPYSEEKQVEPYIAKTKAQLIAEEAEEIGKRRRSRAAALRLPREEYLAIAERDDLYRNYDLMRGKLPYGYGSIDLTDEAALFKRVKRIYKGALNEDGDLVSTYNPDSKWDWYEIGGRWPSQLRLKDGTAADSAPAGEVDWDKMLSTSPAKEAERAEFWDEYVLGKTPEGIDGEKYLQAKYPYEFYRPEYYIEFYGTKEEYVRRMGLWYTYAAVDEKGWHEPGKMGWWGCSSSTAESQKDWEDNFRARFIDTLDPEDRVIIVDCHI